MDQKLLLACFLGGVVCSATAFLLTPTLWWLGIPAGFIAGYFAYEFREAIRESKKAAPVIFDSVIFFIRAILEWLVEIVFFLTEPLPVYAIAAAIIVLVTLVQPGSPLMNDLHSSSHMEFVRGMVEGSTILAGVSLFCWFILLVCLFFSYAFEIENVVGLPFFRKLGWGEVGYRIVKGLVMFLFMSFCWAPWEVLVFGYGVVKRIHSNKRTLCGLDGALGGAISYLVMPHQGVASALLMVAFGGLYGAALGMAVWYWLQRHQQVS